MGNRITFISKYVKTSGAIAACTPKEVNSMAEERGLEEMSLKELKQHAKRAGISGYGKMNKGQLLTVLESSPVSEPMVGVSILYLPRL